MGSIASRQNADDSKRSEIPPRHVPDPLLLYQIVTFTVLILGVSDFARTGSTTLIYVAVGMATAQAGQSIVKNLLFFLKERFLPGNSKKP